MSKPSAGHDAERWLFVDGAADLGGHEIMLMRLVEEIGAHGGVTPIVLARAGSGLRERAAAFRAPQDLPAASRIERFGADSLAFIVHAMRDAWTFARVAFRVKATLCIIAEGCLLAQPIFAMVARLLGQRVVVYVPLLEPSRTLGFGRGRTRDALVQYFYANLPHAWITITQEQATEFAAWARVRRPIFSLPNTVAKSIDRIARSDAGQESDGHTSVRPALRILVLGRLESHQKGLDQLMDFLSARNALVHALTISFVGSGPFESELRRRIGESPALGKWVCVRPWANPVEAMREHDVLLITSRYEGVPLVMLEAMALGMPVVSTDLPGTRAFLPAQCLFPVGDMERAFDIIATLRDPQVRGDFIRRNRATYAAQASADVFTARVSALTTELRGLAYR